MGKYAVIIVSTLIFAMITYSHGLKNVLLSSHTQVAQSYKMAQAQNIAQSTAMVAVNNIREDNTSYIPGADQVLYFPDSDNYESWGDLNGEYRVEIENSGDSLLTVRSEGRLDQTEYLVTVRLNQSDPLWQPNVTHAVFAGSRLDMTGSSSIIGDVGTNAVTAGAVHFNGNPQITGGLTVGPDGDPDEVLEAPDWKGNNDWIQGGLSSASEPFEFELPPFPEFPPQTNPANPINLSGLSSTTLPGSDLVNKYIPEIKITGDNTLTIDTQGNDMELHIGDLNIQQGHLEFIGGGEVTLKIEDNLTVNGSSTLNGPGDTDNLLTYYKGTNEVNLGGATDFNSDLFAETADIKLAGSGGLQGDVITGGDNVTITGAADAISRVIYGPNADVELTGSGSVRGSIVSDTFSARGNSSVTFEGDDSELPDIKLEEGETEILSWH